MRAIDIEYTFLSLSGRMRRRDFWYAAALLVIAEVALVAVLAWSGDIGWREFLYGTRRVALINLAAFSFLFWPSLAITVKRLHDRDTSGWWGGLLHLLAFLLHAHLALGPVPGRNRLAAFIGLLPLALFVLLGAWLLVELVLLRGTRGPNRYGHDPIAVQMWLATQPAPAAQAPAQ